MDSKRILEVRRRWLRDWTPESNLHLNVIFTTAPGTRAALEAASRLAKGLKAQLTIVAPLAVPHRLPLDQPMISPDHVRRQILSILPGLAAENYIRIDICVCRDELDCLKQFLPAGSLVFLGGRASLLARQRHLEKALRGLGHEVIFVKQGGR